MRDDRPSTSIRPDESPKNHLSRSRRLTALRPVQTKIVPDKVPNIRHSSDRLRMALDSPAMLKKLKTQASDSDTESNPIKHAFKAKIHRIQLCIHSIHDYGVITHYQARLQANVSSPGEAKIEKSKFPFWTRRPQWFIGIVNKSSIN